MKFITSILLGASLVLFLGLAGCKKETFTSRDTSGLKPTPVDPPPPPDPTVVSFDPAESLDAWEIAGPGPKNAEKVGAKEGEAWLKSAIVNGEDYIHFIKRRPTAVDANLSEEDGQFVFWFYVSDVTALKEDGQIEMTSSGESDKKEYSWNVAPLIPSLKNGWNELALNFSDAAKSDGDGGPDIHAFNFFRIYFWTKDKAHADLEVGVDDLRFRKKPAAPPPSYILFDAADKLEDWEIAGPGPKTEEKAGKKEGEGWLKSAIITGEDYIHFIKRRPTPVNPNLTEANGQFVFWFYVSDVSALKEDGQIELTSSGESDKKEYSWNVAPLLAGMKNGWNEMRLNFSSAAKSDGDGGPDITAFNFFRIYFWTKDKTHANVEVGVDGLRFEERQVVSLSFDNCDAIDQWETAGGKGTIEKAGKKEGEGWLAAPITNGEDYMHFIKRRPSVLNSNLTKATGALKLWVYIEDVSKIKDDGQFELTSSGESDKNEYSWNLGPMLPNLKNGWNELTLAFSDAAESSGDGGPDLSKFNFFRLYLWTSGKDHPDVKIGLDDLRIVEK